MKDENLIFGERLKKAGVQTEIAYYSTCFHGMVHAVNKYELSKQILEDLVNYMMKTILN